MPGTRKTGQKPDKSPVPWDRFIKEGNIMAKELNLQDVFLNQARKDRIPVTIYITNGFQFKGIVKGFDNYTVILDTDGKQNLIYKHAISTITPLRPISLLDAFDKEDGENRE